MSGYGISPPASFAQGVMQGYGFMDDIYDRRAKRDRQAKMDELQFNANERAQQQHDAKMDEYQVKRDDRTMKRGWAALNSGVGTLSPEAAGLIFKYGLIPGEKMEEAEQDLQAAKSMIESGDLSQFTSGEGLAILNRRLAPDINSDPQGNPLPGRREITGIYPGKEKGTAVFELAGEYEDGTPFSGQPMTVGRGTEKDGDNTVKQQFVGGIAKNLQAQMVLARAYKQDPEFKAALDTYAKHADWSKGDNKKLEKIVSGNDELYGYWKDGKFVEVSRGSRWNPNSQGWSVTTPEGVSVQVGGSPGGYKVPSGYRLKDASKPNAGLEPIPGGPADEQSPGDAAKTQMLQQGLTDVQRARQSLYGANGEINRKILAQMETNLPFSKGRDLYSMLYNAIEGKLRAESGAAVPEPEVQRMARRFVPSVFDDDATIRNKLTRLEEYLGNTVNKIDPSGRFQTPSQDLSSASDAELLDLLGVQR